MSSPRRRPIIVGVGVLISSVAVGVGAGSVAARTPAAASGTLRIAEAAAPESLDPAVEPNYQMDEFAAVYDTLVTTGAGGKITPDLAKSWKLKGKSITFQLRKGVKFQDGTPFNAAAVKAEFDRIENPATKSTNAKSILGPYVKSTVLSPYTLKVTWSSVPAGELRDLGDASVSIPSPTAAAAGSLGTHPVGTGPYEYVSYTPGSQLVLKANPSYTSIRPDLTNHGAPKYSQVIFSYVSNEATRANLLSTGQVQLTRLDGIYAKQAAGNSSLVASKFPSIAEYWMAVNTRLIPDLHVRNAIFSAINRPALLAATGSGFGQLNENYLPTTIIGWSKSVTIPSFSTKKALADMKAGGYAKDSHGILAKKGKELPSFQIVSPNEDPYPALDQLIQNQLSKIGIKTTILEQTDAASLQTPRAGKQGFFVGAYGVLDPPSSMNADFGCASVPHGNNPGYNFMFWCNHKFDKLVADAAKDPSLTGQTKTLIAAQKMLMAARVSMTLYQQTTNVFSQKSVGGIGMQVDGNLKMNDLAPR